MEMRRVARAAAVMALFFPAISGCDPSDGPDGSLIEHVDPSNFDQRVLKSDIPVVVDFYADWCVPCRRFLPMLAAFAEETPEARIVKVNVDESPRLAARYGIRYIPYLIVFKHGQPVAWHGGPASKAELRALLGR
jgi:thioredoxin 1